MEIAEIKVMYSTNQDEKVKITNSQNAYKVSLNSWDMNIIELQEEFKILLLNRNNEVLGIYVLSRGGTTATIVDVKLLFSVALKSNTHSIILVHNHPSGNLTPSTSDKDLTSKIKSAGKYLDISILDHLIISRINYYSFADNGIL